MEHIKEKNNIFKKKITNIANSLCDETINFFPVFFKSYFMRYISSIMEKIINLLKCQYSSEEWTEDW